MWGPQGQAGMIGFIAQHPALPAMALPSWGWLVWRPSLNQPSSSLLGTTSENGELLECEQLLPQEQVLP